MVAQTCVCNRCEWLPEMWRANEVAPGSIDTGCHSRWFGTGGVVGARPTQAKESAPRATLAAISEDASAVKERRVLRDVALAFAGASAQVCPRVKKIRCA